MFVTHAGGNLWLSGVCNLVCVRSLKKKNNLRYQHQTQ